MGFNRLVDRRIDAANPRTAEPRPAGGAGHARRRSPCSSAASAALLVLAAWQLNPLALALSPRRARHPLPLLLHQAVHLGLPPGPRPLARRRAAGRLDRGARRRRGHAAPARRRRCSSGWPGSTCSTPSRTWTSTAGRASSRSRPASASCGALWISALLHALMLALLALLPRVYPPGLGPGFWVGWAGCLAPDRLPALGGPAGRPVAPERRLLHRQRRPLGLALRHDGA